MSYNPRRFSAQQTLLAQKNPDDFLPFGCLYRKKCGVLTVLKRNRLLHPFSIQKLNSHLRQYYNLEKDSYDDNNSPKSV